MPPLIDVLSRPRPLLFMVSTLVLIIMVPGSVVAEEYELTERTPESRVFDVRSRLSVEGKLTTATGDGQAINLNLKVAAEHDYAERQLPPAGRDARAFRSARIYQGAQATIDVNKNRTLSRLGDRLRFVVSNGKREGLQHYSPDGPLTFDELELLHSPGDGLALQALLPVKPVQVGESWSPSSWVMQFLCGIEAVLKSDLKCQLQNVQNGEARVSFSGSLEGATLGASASITIGGHFLFDLNQGFISSIHVEQKEKRLVGTVSPGMDLTATVDVQRTLRPDPSLLADQRVQDIPLEPKPSDLNLRFASPWSIGFSYGRGWNIFHRTSDVVILRLLDNGNLLAQCNVSPVPAVSPGKHTSESQFQADIRRALGAQLGQIASAEQIKTDDGRYLYRVTVVGESNKLPMHWFYYLCAAPSGKQVALVFAVESKFLEQFGKRDLSMVQRLEFKDSAVSPASGTR